ncbi:hypothetical protein [Nocardioides nitrophenolicus]|uniref:hypothetical protein n=1 Tax=Nocardioides nitrophenolicus TaxID=60489 RepID=UPI001957E41B|nr:hypothetical protein [Nocardioides nitrophenolicus]MBM7518983.1 hypothetical protein [Nocardioides nitrophenolicus]
MSHDEPTTELPREERPADGARRTGRHRVNTGHLVMGVAFTGLVIVWALAISDRVQLQHNGWIMGLPWLAAGAAGLVASVLRGRHPDPSADQHAWDGHQMRGWQ